MPHVAVVGGPRIGNGVVRGSTWTLRLYPAEIQDAIDPEVPELEINASVDNGDVTPKDLEWFLGRF